MSRDPRAVLNGATAAAAQLAGGELIAAALPRARSPVSGLGRTLIDRMPGPGIDITVATAETMDKSLLRGALVAQWLGLGVLANRLEQRRRGSGAAALLAQGVAAGAAAAHRPQAATGSSLAAGLGGGLVGALALRGLGDEPAPSRLAIAGGLAGLAACAAARLRRAQGRSLAVARDGVVLPAPSRAAPDPPPGAELDVPGLTPLFTPLRDFYVTDVAFPAPRVDPRSWSLRVHGLVDSELTLTLDELLAMELVELDATLVCVHNPVGGPRIGTARWLGIPLAHVLARAGVKPQAEQLIGRSIDGFTAGVPVDWVTGEAPALIALGMNGKPLPVVNGFPARLLIPGLWGADASTKWLGELELTTWAAVEDYWDSRGWPRWPPAVRPGSRIDVPAHRSHLHAGPSIAAGVAWAPPDGVAGVEVSIDDGPWVEAELSAEIAPTAWRQWRHPWVAEPGEHELRVRTLGRAGIQPAEPAPPYPEGSAGYQQVRVRIHPTNLALPARDWRARVADAGADARRRIRLAAMAPPAWLRHGYPGSTDFPHPSRSCTSPFEREA